MKVLLLSLAALGLALGPGLTQDDPPQEDPLAERVQALEDEVASLKRDLAAKTAKNEEILRYLAGEKTRGTALLRTFDEAEQAGFTAGINFRSREILLAGLRAYVNDAQKGLPGGKKADSAGGGGR
ncbi:MAG: hypothetical protein AAF682_10935 [Planctomycetota bacterium]